MTEIFFHVNAPDKVAYACRLLRKATNAGAATLVAGEPQALVQLDVTLWTFSSPDFLPHCFDNASARMLAASPIWLASGAQIDASARHGQMLLNLGAQVPDGFERFEKLIELVGPDTDDLQLGRARWKHYARRGYALTKHDVAELSVIG